ncbi:MAG: glycosyltransferase [Silvanigrellaceae bacterium]|nr:glycosyltransferase [Silvanigrellaceae bacterium]
MPDKKLIVIGSGPEAKKIQNKLSHNIQFLGYQDFFTLKSYLEKAKAFVFAAEEDFGISPVEAQACGTPVIAFGKGGAKETIQGLAAAEPTGVFFEEQTPASLINAIKEFEANEQRISPLACRKNAERFSQERFREEFFKIIQNVIKK